MGVRKLGKREIVSAIYANLASWLNDADYGELFGDDFADEISDSEANEDRVEEARAKVIAALRKKVKP